MLLWAGCLVRAKVAHFKFLCFIGNLTEKSLIPISGKSWISARVNNRFTQTEQVCNYSIWWIKSDVQINHSCSLMLGRYPLGSGTLAVERTPVQNQDSEITRHQDSRHICSDFTSTPHSVTPADLALAAHGCLLLLADHTETVWPCIRRPVGHAALNHRPETGAFSKVVFEAAAPVAKSLCVIIVTLTASWGLVASTW